MSLRCSRLIILLLAAWPTGGGGTLQDALAAHGASYFKFLDFGAEQCGKMATGKASKTALGAVGATAGAALAKIPGKKKVTLAQVSLVLGTLFLPYLLAHMAPAADAAGTNVAKGKSLRRGASSRALGRHSTKRRKVDGSPPQIAGAGTPNSPRSLPFIRPGASKEDILAEELWSIANLGQPLSFEELGAYEASKKFYEREKYSGEFAAESGPNVKSLAYLRLAAKRLGGKVSDINDVRLYFLVAALESPSHFENGYLKNSSLTPLIKQVNGYEGGISKFPKYLATSMSVAPPRSDSLMSLIGKVMVNLKDNNRQELFLKMILCMASDPSEPTLQSTLKTLGVEYCDDEDSIVYEIWRTTTPGVPIDFVAAGPEAKKFFVRMKQSAQVSIGGTEATKGEDTMTLILALFRRPIGDGARARLAYLQAATASQVLKDRSDPHKPMLKLLMYNSMLVPDHTQLDWIFHNSKEANASDSSSSSVPLQLWYFLAESFAILQNDSPPLGALAQRRAQLICVCTAMAQKLEDAAVGAVNAAVKSLGAKSCEVFDNMIEAFWSEPFGKILPAEQIKEITESVDLVEPMRSIDATKYHQLVLGAISDRPVTDESRLRIVFMILAIRFGEHFKPGEEQLTKQFLATVSKEIEAVKKHNAKNLGDCEPANNKLPNGGGGGGGLGYKPSTRALSSRVRTLLSDKPDKKNVKRDAKQYVKELANLVGCYSLENAADWATFEAVAASSSSEARKSGSGGIRLMIARKLISIGNSLEASAN